MLSATSQTDEESKIRTSEVKLISDFVKRAKEVQPDGVLVVVHEGKLQDVRLQREDIITIPERSDFVLVSGEVAVAQAVVHRAGETADDYIARVGGYSNRADRGELLVIRRTGEVLRNERSDIRSGDEIVVLPEVPVKNLQIAKTILQTIFQAALSAGVVLGI